ncbi:MAG: sortase [Candidatus Saccharimonas sp.]
MLRLSARKKRSIITTAIGSVAVVALVAGIYIVSLVLAPSIAPIIATKPIDAAALPAPKANENRIVIPKIGVNIHYAPGGESLDRGAEWRHPDRGNPIDGGNFIIAAHRLSIQPTPQGTVEKSPFYQIDKMSVNDEVVIDYNGKRYLYKITKIFDVKPTQVEIEAPSEKPILTIYTCSLGGATDGRVVLLAEPLGEVAL